MRRFSKILLAAVAGLLSLVVLTTVSLAAIWFFPSLVLNPTGLRLALKFGLSSAVVDWNTLSLDAESVSWGEKRIHLNAAGVCYATAGTSSTSLCAKSMVLELHLALHRGKWSVQIPQLLIKGVEGDVALSRSETKPAEKSNHEGWSLPSVPAWLNRFGFEEMQLVLGDLRVLRSEKQEQGWEDKIVRLSGHLTANATAAGGSEWQLAAQGYEIDRFGRRPMRGTIELSSQKSLWAGPYLGKIDIAAALPGRKKFFIKGDIAPRTEDRVDFHIQGGLQGGKADSQVAMEGKLFKDRVEVGFAGVLRSEQATVRPEACALNYRWQVAGQASGQASLQCPLRVEVPPDHRFSRALRAELQAQLSAAVNWPVDGNQNGFRGRVDLHSASLLKSAQDFRVDFGSAFSGNFSDLPGSLDLDTQARIDVGDFKSIATALRETRYAVPVPFAELGGSLSLHCGMHGKPVGAPVNIPCQVNTRLKSQHQRFFIDTEGTVIAELMSAAVQKVTWTVRLKEVDAVLPYLSLQAPPRLVPDSRIRVKDVERAVAKGPKGPPVDYEIRVLADPQRPVRLYSNLAKNPVPLVADLRMTRTEPMKGTLRIASVDLDLFRRQAYLHHLRFRFVPRIEQSEVDGQIRVVYADYTIDVNILGQIGSPEIKLSSSPPLSDKDAWAVLLFGKKLETLDNTEAMSVGSARTAMADGALSLASMYLLASTPIESVGYDPSTRIFEARLKLADGTSLNIGADDQAVRRLGIRKRLARNWYVTTSVKNPFESVGDQALSTLLEWSIGY